MSECTKAQQYKRTPEMESNFWVNGRFSPTTNPMLEQVPMPKAVPAPAFGHDFSRVNLRGEPMAKRALACGLLPMRCPIGGACHTCPVQNKLTLGQPNDKYELEADRIADQVMNMPDPRMQRACSDRDEETKIQPKPLADQITSLVQRQPESEEEDEEAVQPKMLEGTQLQRQGELEEEEEETAVQPMPITDQIIPLVQQQVEVEDDEEGVMQPKRIGGHVQQVGPGLEAQIQVLQGGGRPLPQSVRTFFEPRFGRDFSQVRIHTERQAAETAKAINATAYAVGRDLVFGLGQYSPETKKGKRLLAHELTHVIQQGHRSSRVQRRIVVGGAPYTPTTAYYSYLTTNFGSHMKEFIKKMHNVGNPPDFNFTSYDQMGYEVRIRHQAIKGIAAVHSGCCNYPDSANPDYLNSTYWNRVGWMHFKAKSPLPSGKEASDAIEAIFAPGAGTRLECLAMTVAIEYYSLLKGLGKSKFNAKFPGGTGLEISTSSSHLPLLIGSGSKYKIVSVSSASKLLPGDWVYFKNFADYPSRNPSGLWRGENAIYLGNGKYRGFGVPSLTETDMNAKLVSNYNSELGESKTVPDLLADGGGLKLNPVVRPKIATLTP